MFCNCCRLTQAVAQGAFPRARVRIVSLNSLLATPSSSSVGVGIPGLCRRPFGSSPASSTPPLQAADVAPRPKLHWTEEFKIRSPKVSASRFEREPVVAIDILSDAFNDRRVAFTLRRTPFSGPLNPRVRGAGKIVSWCALASLPYLAFCKWAGGTPLLGDMATYAIPATVAGVSLGYLALNWALERAVFRRRILSVALDEVDHRLVYITTMPVGGLLHGEFRTYATRIDNLSVELSGRSSAKLRFKAGGGELGVDWLSLPTSRRQVCVVDARAMAEFANSCLGRPPAATSASATGASDIRGFDRITLPSEDEIDKHLESSLRGSEQSQQPLEAPAEDKAKTDRV